jgi:hypothetical protein
MHRRDEDSGGIGKKNIKRIAGVSTRQFDATAKTKQSIQQKTYLLSASALVSGQQNNSK